MRKTKIICTIGPSSSSYETITALCKAGMNVARLNFSHGSHEEHLQKINTLKKVRNDLNIPLALMLDTKGPEYRIKTFENGSVILKYGDEFIFTSDDITGNEKRVSVNYKNLPDELNPEDRILLNDGLLEFKVIRIDNNDIVCKCLSDGKLSDRKSMSFPGKTLKQIYLSDQDKSDLLFGIENEVDFVSCSFVSCKKDLDDVRAFLDANGGSDILLIAKIENQSGVDNIDDILKSCTGVMVARGDMGVEIPYEHLPRIQKMLIKKCRIAGKISVTATEMLESMINKPRPTRAEISDVANAVFDGTSAIMLSGETAAGNFPVESVKSMAKIALTAEESIDYKKQFYSDKFVINGTADAFTHSTCDVALSVGAKAVTACTSSGATARYISRFRLPMDIIGITPNKRTYESLALSWGVTPLMCGHFDSMEKMFVLAGKMTEAALPLQKGDKYIITNGIIKDDDRSINVLSLETV